jgi:hypothetical protein
MKRFDQHYGKILTLFVPAYPGLPPCPSFPRKRESKVLLLSLFPAPHISGITKKKNLGSRLGGRDDDRGEGAFGSGVFSRLGK